MVCITSKRTAVLLLISALLLGGCVKNRLATREARFNNRVLMDKGLAYLAKGNARMALPSLQKARKGDPRNVQILSALGRCLDMLGRHAQALEVLERAHELDDDNGAISHDFGVALMRQNRLEEAEKAILKALEDPTFQGVPDAHVNLAILHKRQGRQREMVQSLEEALNADPGHIPAYLQLAGFYADFDRYDRQRHYLEKALPHSEDPLERAGIMEQLAAIHLKNGERHKALPLLQQIMQLAPQSEMAQRAGKKALLLE